MTNYFVGPKKPQWCHQDVEPSYGRVLCG